MKYLEELKTIALPADQFAVFGSGPLAIRGWRENDDLDLIVLERQWQELIKKYEPISDKEIKIGHVSIYKIGCLGLKTAMS